MKQYRADPEFYDAENESSRMLQQDVPFFLGHLPKKRQDVLEIAVGTGRAAIPIAQAGHRVIGIDNNRAMLTLARRKRDSVGLSDRQLDLRLMDALKVKLDRKFDWICLFFNTLLAFTTIEQQDQLLSGVHKHLKPRGRGRFWLDIFNPDIQRLAQPRASEIDATLMFLPADGRSVLRTVDVQRDLARQVQRITFNYRWFDEHGQQKRRKQQFDLTFIFPRELQLLLERNGLVIERMYGNYDGSALGEQSPRIIVLASHL
jgi:SAM-dependent methyltransferase